MDPCFVAPELLLWLVAKPSLSLQAPNLQAQLLERRGARPARSYTSYGLFLIRTAPHRPHIAEAAPRLRRDTRSPVGAPFRPFRAARE